MFGQCACVNLVAKSTGSSPLDLVDVNVVKIALAIPKSGQRCGALFLHQFRIMTTETEIVSPFAKGSVTLLRVLIRQEPKMTRAMRPVAP